MAFSLIFLVASIYFHIFARMAKGLLSSDLLAHISILESGLSGTIHRLFHYTVSFFSWLFGISLGDAAVITLTVYSFFSGLLLYFFLLHYLKQLVGQHFILLLTVTLMLISAVYLPSLHPTIYLGIGSPNPFHNPTTIAVKPFAYAATLFILYSTYNQQPRFTYYIVIASIFTLLSAYAKPNFALTLVGATPLFLFYLSWQKGLPADRLKYIALPAACAFFALGLQFAFKYYAFPDNPSDGIAIGWLAVATAYNEHPLLGVIQLAAFPILSLCILPGILKDRFFTFSLFLFISAILQYIFLHETGIRMYHGNFGWGRMITVSMLFASALGYTVRYFLTHWEATPLWKIVSLISIYFLHIISGLIYIFQLMTYVSYH